MKDLVLSCLESRVEDKGKLYARFLIAPFYKGDALTVGTALRRALLSSKESIGIGALYIQGITHEFSTIVGVRESVLELCLNFQQIVLSKKRVDAKQENGFWSEQQVGYLHVQGPKVIYANDLQLPLGVSLVDPTQYIATLSTEGLLVVKFLISTEDSYSYEYEKSKASYKDTIYSKAASPEALLKSNHSLDELESKGIVKAKRLKLVNRNQSLNLLNPYRTKISKEVRKRIKENNLVIKIRPSGQERDRSLGPFLAFKNRSENSSVGDQFGNSNMGMEERLANVRAKTISDKSLRSPKSLRFLPWSARSLSNENYLTKNAFFRSDICLRNVISLGTIPKTILKVNFVVETDDLANQIRERLIFEVWTNGSVDPRQAIHSAALSLVELFGSFRYLFQFK